MLVNTRPSTVGVGIGVQFGVAEGDRLGSAESDGNNGVAFGLTARDADGDVVWNADAGALDRALAVGLGIGTALNDGDAEADAGRTVDGHAVTSALGSTVALAVGDVLALVA